MVDYTQTHVLPTEGLPAWAGPDGSGPPAANLDPGLDVMVLESRGEWAHIRCSNGWEAWVHARRLIASQPAPTPPPPPAQPASPPPAQPAPPPPMQQAAPPSPTQAAPPPPTQGAPPTQPGPPSAAWGTPGPVPGAPRAAGAFSIGPGQIIALVGGLLFLVSGWFTWLRFEAGGQSASFTSYEFPAHYLLDSQSDLGGLSLGIVIAFFGVACIAAALISAFNRRLGIVTLGVGVAAFLVAVLFFVQTRNSLDALPSIFSGYFSTVRFGGYIALVGAISTFVGGLLALAQKRS